MGLAECAGEDGEQRSWGYTDKFFDDEVATKDFREFPETLQQTMEICWACPVRRECLEAAYAQEKHVDDTNKLKPQIVEDSTRFGVRGGIPGRIRTMFAPHPDRLDAAEDWLGVVAEHLQWGFTDVVDDLFAAKRKVTEEETA